MYLFIIHVEVFQFQVPLFREKGKNPKFLTHFNFHLRFASIRPASSLFRSVVYKKNCSVQPKANRFVSKHSYDSSVILLVTVIHQVRYCFVAVRVCRCSMAIHHIFNIVFKNLSRLQFNGFGSLWSLHSAVAGAMILSVEINDIIRNSNEKKYYRLSSSSAGSAATADSEFAGA